MRRYGCLGAATAPGEAQSWPGVRMSGAAAGRIMTMAYVSLDAGG
jgi:hypothetical protein